MDVTGVDVTGVVVRRRDRVLRITPPAPVSYTAGPDSRPISQCRNAETDFEYLAGSLRCTLREWGRVIFDGTSERAGLEIGHRPV